jgi:peptide/nickel transport system permease protein
VLARIAARVAWSIFSIWAVATLAFVINQALPADPARAVTGPQARPADVARIRAQLGLDRPVWVQYRIFAGRLLHLQTRPSSDDRHANCAEFGPVHFDLGVSYQARAPVVSILAERLPRTLMLAAAAVSVQTALGLLVGILAALKRNTPWDYGTVSATLIGVSAPTYVVGILLQYVFAYRLRLLPLDGYGVSAADHARSVVLPALTLGISGAAYYARLVRSDVLDLLDQDFVRTAKAKGLPMTRVVAKHVLRNALLPLVTVMGLNLGSLVGGAIVTEKLFRWPGLGQLSVDAVFDRDAPVIMGTVIVSAVAIVLSNLLVDLSYAFLDPRTRTG